MTDPKVELAFGSGYSDAAADRVWTDVTRHAKISDPITVGHGRSDEFATTDANSLTLTFDNSDGLFTPDRQMVENSGFEVDLDGWAAILGVTGIVRTTARSHTGIASMRIEADGTGSAFVQSPETAADAMPVLPGATYTAKGWWRFNGTARDCRMILAWRDADGSTISTSEGDTITDSGDFTQASVTATAPAHARSVSVRGQVFSPAAGEFHFLDDVTVTADSIKVGVPVRTSANLLTAGDGGSFEANPDDWDPAGGSCTVARTTDEAHAGTASLELTATGTANMQVVTPPGLDGMPVIPGQTLLASCWFRAATDARDCNVRLDLYEADGSIIAVHNATSVADATTGWVQSTLELEVPDSAAFARMVGRVQSPAGAGEVHYLDSALLLVPRFTGYVDEWLQEWPAVVSDFATTRISARSRLARLGIANQMQGLLTMSLGDFTTTVEGYWPLTRGHLRNTAPGGDLQALHRGPATKPLVELTDEGAVFDGGQRLALGVDGVLWTIAVTFRCDENAEGTWLVGTSHHFPDVGTVVATSLGIDSDGLLHTRRWSTGMGSPQTITIGTVPVTDGEWHTAIWGQEDEFTDPVVYLDGVKSTSDFVSNQKLLIGAGIDWDGNATDPTFPRLPTFKGAIRDVIVMVDGHILTAADAELYDETARTYLDGDSPGTMLERYATLDGIAAAEVSAEAGRAVMAGIDPEGLSTLALLRRIELTEGGVLFDAPDGTLTFHGRAHRYNAAAALTLSVTAGEVQPGYAPLTDRSALTNIGEVETADGVELRYEDTDSRNEHGPHVWSATLDTHDEADALNAAGWRVNNYKDATARVPTLTVELATLTDAQKAEVLAIGIGDRITVTGLPGSAANASEDFFMEGYTESIGDTLHRITFNVSPGAPWLNVWVLGDATKGIIGPHPDAIYHLAW